MFKISRRDERDIILYDIVLFSKEKFFFILTIMIKIIFLLLLYIWLYLMSKENILIIFSLIVLLLFFSFYRKIKNSQLIYHKEILKDYLITFFSLGVFLLNLFALNNLNRDNLGIKLIILVLGFPSLFVLNFDKTKQNIYLYISKGELYFLNILDSIFFTILNSLFIVFMLDSGIDFFFLSIAVFIFRLFFYTIKIVFLSFSSNLMSIFLFLSFFLNIVINVILKYAVW
ncbi:MAG: hypothetical protein WHT27_01165 [candidate division WOR-3 bacterium]